MYICGMRTLSIELELSGGEEVLVRGSEPVVEVDADDPMTTGNAVA